MISIVSKAKTMRNRPPAKLLSALVPSRSACLLLLILGSSGAAAQDQEASDNGTDPTRFNTTAVVAYEHNDLVPDLTRNALRMDMALPFGDKRDYNVRVSVPIVRNDARGNNGYDIGDVGIRMGHVFGLSKAGGYVVQGELIMDTAARPELGTGKHVFKGSLIFARFVRSGIFAPALVHSVDVGGDGNRAGVNTSTVDFYYVPKLGNPKAFMTLDPSLTSDWENDRVFGGLAVTLGHSVGKGFGGNMQLYAKPALYAGADRPGDWSLELGFKVLGF